MSSFCDLAADPCLTSHRYSICSSFKACRSELSASLEWNETIIFSPFPIDQVVEHDFPIRLNTSLPHQILDMAMDISLWETDGAADKLLGETISK